MKNHCSHIFFAISLILRGFKTFLKSLNWPVKNSSFIIHHSSLKLPVIKAQAAVFNSQIGTDKVSTIGGILVDKFKFKYGLGTCHGLKRKFVDNQSEFMGDRDDEIIHKNDDTFFGKLKAILFSDEMDIALVRLDGRRKIAGEADNTHIGHPTQVHTPSVKDAENALKVVIFSEIQGGKEIEGFVIEWNTDCIVEFTINGKVERKMKNLMSISTDTDLTKGKSLTVDGDSGVWVRTKDKNEVVGMVIGAKDNKTYLMKMENILNACEKELNFKLNLLINENIEKDVI